MFLFFPKTALALGLAGWSWGALAGPPALPETGLFPPPPHAAPGIARSDLPRSSDTSHLAPISTRAHFIGNLEARNELSFHVGRVEVGSCPARIIDRREEYCRVITSERCAWEALGEQGLACRKLVHLDPDLQICRGVSLFIDGDPGAGVWVRRVSGGQNRTAQSSRRGPPAREALGIFLVRCSSEIEIDPMGLGPASEEAWFRLAVSTLSHLGLTVGAQSAR